ncbi:MAG: hypothetical protein K0S24_1317 [Sphingobacterium sp.]|jgi:hypothetical protein|nr:hypothetical protein [Sphingobacterium sp.]
MEVQDCCQLILERCHSLYKFIIHKNSANYSQRKNKVEKVKRIGLKY